MLIHKTGDLLALAEQGEFDIIVQGCNCYNTMGSGIAKQIREKYPQAWVADCNNHCIHENVIEKLGNYSYAMAENFMIVNAYTQVTFNSATEPFSDRFEYDSFAVILRKLAEKHGTRRFGFPNIGQGLGGGDPIRINALLECFSEQVNSTGGTVTIVSFDK